MKNGNKNTVKILTYINIMLAAFTISKNIDKQQEENLYYESEIVIEELTKKQISDYINNNSNLTLDEKIFLYDTHIILLENAEYIVVEQVKYFLENVDLNYGNLSGGLAGTYQPGEELIEIRDEELEEKSYSVLLHEILHGYTYNLNYTSTSSRYLNEIYNEICTVEYAKELGIPTNPTLYDLDLIIGYVLAEIIDIDVINKYKFNADFNIIENELLKIGVEEKVINDFYNTLNTLYYLRITLRDVTSLDDIYLNMFKVLENFYEAKYNESILDNIEILFLIKNTVLDNEMVTDKVDRYIENTIYYEGKYSIEDNMIFFEEKELSVEYKELFNNTKGYEDHKQLYYGYERIIDNNLSPDADFKIFSDNFYNAIMENDNLSESEKIVVEVTLPFINNYFKYLNKEEIINIISTLDIEYISESVLSKYDANDNVIIINKNEDIISTRELLFGNIIKLYTNKEEDYNGYIYDVANEMFKCEYYPYMNPTFEAENLFENDMHIAYFVHELLGVEFLYEYKFNPSNISLINYLLELGLKEKEIGELINMLDELYIIKSEGSNNESMSNFIYKFYEFLKLYSNEHGSYSNELERAAFLAKRRIEINYTISTSEETVVFNDKLYLLDEINVFEKYSYSENNLFDIRVRK